MRKRDFSSQLISVADLRIGVPTPKPRSPQSGAAPRSVLHDHLHIVQPHLQCRPLQSVAPPPQWQERKTTGMRTAMRMQEFSCGDFTGASFGFRKNDFYIWLMSKQNEPTLREAVVFHTTMYISHCKRRVRRAADAASSPEHPRQPQPDLPPRAKIPHDPFASEGHCPYI